MIVTVFISDRQDLYLPGCIASYEANVEGEVDAWTVIDDRDHRLGLAGAARAGFRWAVEQDCDYALWVEEDFRFTTPIRLDELRHVLEREPKLAQIVLKRQPWSPEEAAAGGIVEKDPDDYIECGAFGRSIRWTEHRRLFSLNPCLIPRHVLEMGWPDGNEAEFARQCLDRGLRFAYFGRKYDPPRVEHVGAIRAHGWRL